MAVLLTYSIGTAGSCMGQHPRTNTQPRGSVPIQGVSRDLGKWEWKVRTGTDEKWSSYQYIGWM